MADNHIDVSIIIPAKNEEKYLPKLLSGIRLYVKSCRKLKFETIVALAPSRDRTGKIAKRFGARVIRGGLPGIGRNRGARIARGNLLIFLDADVTLSRNFFSRAIREFNERGLDFSSVDIHMASRNRMDLFLQRLNNIVQRATERTKYAYATGMCIIVKRKIFFKVRGFDEKISFAEDADLTCRLAKAGGKFRILNSCHVTTSNRRFASDGRIKTISRFINAAIKHGMGNKITGKYDYFRDFNLLDGKNSGDSNKFRQRIMRRIRKFRKNIVKMR
ncbi:MAG: glycosyltransferase [Candidatus Woesearchaeota archaeon]|nr:glycosyltransferase [Candidatus Woesearchaeota archaeon]